MILYLFAILSVVCIIVVFRYKRKNEELFVLLKKKTNEASSISSYSDVILQNLGVFIFLVTKDFIVVKTNCYEYSYIS